MNIIRIEQVIMADMFQIHADGKKIKDIKYSFYIFFLV